MKIKHIMLTLMSVGMLIPTLQDTHKNAETKLPEKYEIVARTLEKTLGVSGFTNANIKNLTASDFSAAQELLDKINGVNVEDLVMNPDTESIISHATEFEWGASGYTLTAAERQKILNDGGNEDDIEVYFDAKKGNNIKRPTGAIESYKPVNHSLNLPKENRNKKVKDIYEHSVFPNKEITKYNGNGSCTRACDLMDQKFIKSSIFKSETGDFKSNYQFLIEDACLENVPSLGVADYDDYYHFSLYGQGTIEINLANVQEGRDFAITLFRYTNGYYTEKTNFSKIELLAEEIDSCDCKLYNERIKAFSMPAGDYCIAVVNQKQNKETIDTSKCYTLQINVDYECDGDVSINSLRYETQGIGALYVSDYNPFGTMPWFTDKDKNLYFVFRAVGIKKETRSEFSQGLSVVKKKKIELCNRILTENNMYLLTKEEIAKF